MFAYFPVKFEVVLLVLVATTNGLLPLTGVVRESLVSVLFSRLIDEESLSLRAAKDILLSSRSKAGLAYTVPSLLGVPGPPTRRNQIFIILFHHNRLIYF